MDMSNANYSGYNKFTFKNVYLAGKISQRDWRHSLVGNLSPQSGSCGEIGGLSKGWPVLENELFGCLNYVGPYFIADDHGCFHGEDSHGTGADRNDCIDSEMLEAGHREHNAYADMRPWTVARCREAIERSDLFFTWIDDPTCYGTLVELGYAKAVNKTIWIAGPKCYRDMWFAYEMAEKTRFINDWLRPDQVFAKMLAENAGQYYTFGSPIEQRFWQIWEPLNRYSGFRLIPQYCIAGYFVDFCHVETKTIIELDGFATHSSTDDIARDRKCQRLIEEQGWHVTRFGGKEISANVQACVDEVFQLLKKRSRKTE